MAYDMHAVSRNRIRRILRQVLIEGRRYADENSRYVMINPGFHQTDIRLGVTRNLPFRAYVRRDIYDSPRETLIRRYTNGDVTIPDAGAFDDARAIIVATARQLIVDDGFTYDATTGRWVKMTTWRYAPAVAQQTVNYPHLSGSMRGRMTEWAEKQNCAVSKLILSIKVEDGVTLNAFAQPLSANYLTIRDTGTLSYAPKGKWEDDDNPWGRAGRQESRPAKLLRGMLRDDVLAELTDAQWEAFAGRIKGAGEAAKMDIELVEGEDIRHWYHENTYSPKAGDTRNSCMRYDNCQYQMDMYCDNPEQIKMVIAHDESGLLGRSIIWHTDDGRRVHDRIYGSEASRSAITDWCLDNDIQKIGRNDAVALENPWHSTYPYLDNMGYMTPDGRVHATDVDDSTYVSSGTDLSAGPPICPECDEFMGWENHSDTCQTCVERQRIEREARWQAAFAANPPATLTYADYCEIPGAMITFRVEGGITNIDIGTVSYRYYRERALNGVIFELVATPALVTA